MTTDNRQMWADLGIDLEPHDALLNALGPIYQEIYLSQKKRPQGISDWWLLAIGLTWLGIV